LVGSAPTSVACHGGAYLSAGVADATMTTLAFDGGVRAHIHVSWLHPFKEQRFIVVGERQMAVFDDTLPHGQKLVLYPHRVDWRDGRVPVAQKAEGVFVELPATEPLVAECEAFLDAVRTRVPPYADGAEGVRVLRVLAAAQTSLERAGAPQSISPAARPSYFVHPSAVVDEGAQIGEGTKVWHFSHISGRTQIGSKCVFGQNVFIAPNVKIGHGVKVQNNVSIYDGVEIEDDVFCGPSMVFTNVMNPRADIERKSEFRKTLIKRGASIGANATIVCGHTVGAHAFVAAGAVVSKDVPDFALVRGVPAVVTGYVCRCAEKLSFSEGHEARCGACGREYTRTGDVVKERARP
jgi:UDP-2-acetamido-3-amino-2,3-dideoxy-glucuronate N-acetyltransferase